MTLKEAIAVIHEGYGDDCPASGDEYLEARLLLIEAGLMDESAVGKWELESKWPRPEPSPLTKMLIDMYLPSVRDALNTSVLLHTFSGEVPDEPTNGSS